MISAALTLAFLTVVAGQGLNVPQRPPSIEYTSKVIFKMTLNNNPVGNIEIGLFDNYVPKTAANFGQLAHGGVQIGPNRVAKFAGSIIHRVVPGFVIQGGDITSGNGRGGMSIYGERFEDENFNLKHYGAGWVSMANSGKDTNNSQFFITLARTDNLDGKHVVFGKVIKGMQLVNKIAGLRTRDEKPIATVRIASATWEPVRPAQFTPLAPADQNS